MNIAANWHITTGSKKLRPDHIHAKIHYMMGIILRKEFLNERSCS